MAAQCQTEIAMEVIMSDWIDHVAINFLQFGAVNDHGSSLLLSWPSFLWVGMAIHKFISAFHDSNPSIHKLIHNFWQGNTRHRHSRST